MKERLQVESKIRDWLAANLEFVAPKLQLIQKEYHLKDPSGASGFVDLLCKDEFGNFVIIEIKRSDKSARQTINEILKYISLIRHKYMARESEIRTIVISTDWHELRRPFSELMRTKKFDLRGFQIHIDESAVPISIVKVEPLPEDFLARKFTLRYALFLFEAAKERDCFFADFKNYLAEILMDDYVILNLCTDPLNGRIMYPFATLIAFQQLPINALLQLIKKLNVEEYSELEVESEFDDAREYRVYLEAVMIHNLDTLGQMQESEVCPPSKVHTMLNAEQWQIELLHKSGIFDRDPRYTKEILIEELAGLDGSNEDIFYGWTDSTQLERLKEIRQQCRYSLRPSPEWLETIDAIMEKLSSDAREFRLMISIYNRRKLIPAIFHTMENRELGYLPQYFIEVDFLDENFRELYYGSLLSNDNWPESPWTDTMTIEQLNERMRELIINPDNHRDVHELGLCYGTTYCVLKDGELRFQGFLQARDGKLESQNNYLFPFVRYAVVYGANLDKLVENFGRAYIRMG